MKRLLISPTILIVMAIACSFGGKATPISEPPAPATQISGPAGRCGDGVCNGPENAAYCPADCAVPIETPSLPTPTQATPKPKASSPAGRCEDGVCDAYEQQNPQVCPQDCGASPTTEPTSTKAPAPSTPTSVPAQTPSPPPAPSPTQTSLPAPTPTPTPASMPDLRISALGFSPNVLISGTPFHALAQLHNDGTQALSGVAVRVEGHPVSSSCSDMTTVHLLQETTVNLDAGQSLPADLSAQINATDEHLVCVKIDPDNAIAESDESNNALGQSVYVGILISIPLDDANTGSVRHDGGTNFTQYAQALPGDGPNDRRVKGFLSWDLSPIQPGAQILSASIVWGTQCFRGGDVGDCTSNRDPFPTLGNLEMWAHYYDTLDIGDFKFTGMYPGTLLFTYTAQPTGSVVVTDAVADAFATGHAFQIYAIFEKNSDSNGIGNGLVFPEGSGPNILEVVYLP